MGIGTLINGKRYDSSSAEIQIVPTGGGGVVGQIAGVVGAIAGGSLFRCQEINYNDSLEPGIYRGIGSSLKLGRTRGEYDAACDFVMYKEEARDMIRLLAGFGGFGEVEFQIVVTYAEAGGLPVVDTIEGVRIKSPSNALAQGSDPVMMKFDCDVMRIKWDGKYLVQDAGIAGVVGNLIP